MENYSKQFWRKTAKWSIVFAFVVGLLFGFLWWKTKQTNKQYLQNGATTHGTVIHAECNDSGNCQNVQVTYQADGKTNLLITHTDSLKPVSQGQSVQLRYLKNNPSKAQLINQDNDANLWLFLLGLMGFLIIAGIVVMIAIKPEEITTKPKGS